MGMFDRKAIDLKRADAGYAFAEQQIENERRRNLVNSGLLLFAGGALIRSLTRKTFGLFGY